MASCKHPQVDYSKVNYSKAAYAKVPSQTVSYAECHDNHVLWDKLAISAKEATEAERIEMHKLALSIVLTSQGISFIHAGTEFLRSKKGVENSYESSDSINAIDWRLKTSNKEVFDYIKALIKLRKDHPAFRMMDADKIKKFISFDNEMPAGIISYSINGWANKDKWKTIRVIFNGTGKVQKLSTSGTWNYAIRNNKFSADENEYSVLVLELAPYSCTVLYQR